MSKKRFYDHPWMIIAAILLITAYLTMQIPKLVIDNDVEIFIPTENPAKILNEETKAIFGSSDIIDVAMKVNHGDVFSKGNLKTVDKLTREFEKIDGVDEVTSLINSDYIEGTSEGMEVADLVEDMKDNEDIEKLKSKIISWREMYGKSLVSNDFKSTQILVKLKENLDAKQKEMIFHELRTVIDENQGETGIFYTAGSTVINVLQGEFMQKDVRALIPFVILIVLISLYLSFGRMGGVILPFITVIISTLWTMGLMAALGISITMVATSIPVLLIAIGSAYGIHIVSHFFDYINHHKGEITDDEYRNYIGITLKHVGKPVLLAGLTTVVGFVSLATGEIVPIKEFGIFTGIGVVSALLIALTLIPALFNLKKAKKKLKDDEHPFMNKIILACYHELKGNRAITIVLLVIIVMLSAIGTRKIVIDNVMIDYFKPTTEIVKADKFINKEFSGTNILNVVIDGSSLGKGSLTNPEILVKMDELKKHFMDSYDYVGNVVSFTDFIKRMNKVMNYPSEDLGEDTNTSNEEYAQVEEDSFFEEDGFFDSGEVSEEDGFFEEDSFFGEDDSYVAEEETATIDRSVAEVEDPIKLINEAVLTSDTLELDVYKLISLVNKKRNFKGEAFNEIPFDYEKYGHENIEGLKNLISQYLLLYSGSLDDYVDDQLEPTQSRMVFQLKSASNLVTQEFKDNINKYVENNFPEGYEVKISGNGDLSLATNNLIVGSQIKSIFYSLVAVFIIVAVSYKSPIAGIFGTIPLAVSLLINFGIMGFLHIKLDVATSMVASIAIGIGVDYTIHFISAYNEHRKKTDDLEEVTKQTLISTGKAIIFNAVSVALGFLVLMFSNFEPLVNLGMLVAITMLTSSMGALIVLPVLLGIFKPKFIQK
jgi:hypothetical protein